MIKGGQVDLNGGKEMIGDARLKSDRFRFYEGAGS